MSKFFSITNGVGSSSSNIDDENISAITTFSSYEISQLLDELANLIIGCTFKEYPADIRAEPQSIFETPNSTNKLMWVLREGVKLTADIDYTITDSLHIEFNTEIPSKYTISILVIGSNNPTLGNSSDSPIIYTQNTPSPLWEVQHGLGFKYPKVILVDEYDNEMEADIKYIDENNCNISFNIPIAGKCICSF